MSLTFRLFFSLTFLVAPVFGSVDHPPQPRVCRPLTENRPESFQQALDTPRPTRFSLMGFRYIRLQQTMDGYAASGQRMVSRDDDGVYSPAECGDDPGLYMVAPFLASRLKMTLAEAVDTSLLLLLVIPLGYAAVVFWCDCELAKKDKILMSAALLALFALGTVIGDLYLIGGSLAAAAVAVAHTLSRPQFKWMPHALALGALAGIANQFRGHSGTAALLFALTFIAIRSGTKGRKFAMASAMLLAYLVVAVCSHIRLATRDRFLATQPSAHVVTASGHPFWHTIWVSLAYVSNPYIPAVKDESAVAKVRSINPVVSYYSPEYEAILKRETIELVLHHPLIILANFLAKAGTILIILLSILSPLVWRRQLGWTKQDLPWLVAIAFSSLFGILAMPAPRYLTGMIAFALLFVASKLGGSWNHSNHAVGARLTAAAKH